MNLAQEGLTGLGVLHRYQALNLGPANFPLLRGKNKFSKHGGPYCLQQLCPSSGHQAACGPSRMYSSALFRFLLQCK